MNSCRTCKHLYYQEESWELPHINWMECDKRPGSANLTSFPFRNTKCSGYEPSSQSIAKKELTNPGGVVL